MQSRQRGPPEELEVVAADAGHVEHPDLEGVHMDLGRLAVEHHGVHAIESFHRCHPLSSIRASVVPVSPVFANLGWLSAELILLC